jgi:hypothetical protein
VDDRPDKANRSSPDIDAIAGPFAIEHTRIDTLEHQRRDAARFLKVVGDIEQEFRSRLEFRLHITVEYHAVSTGQDWEATSQALRRWVAQESIALPFGHSEVGPRPGIPFTLWVHKMDEGSGGVYFARFAPNDESLPIRIRAAVDRKVSKLAPYSDEGKTTILLVENDDVALMNDSLMLNSFREALPSRAAVDVDEIWYADTSATGDLRFQEITPYLSP